VTGRVACQDIQTWHMQQVVNAAPTAKEGARVHGMISALVAAGIEAGYLANPRLAKVHRALAEARARAEALALDLAETLDRARDLAKALDRARDLGKVRAHTKGRADDLARARARAVALDLAKALDRPRDVAKALDRARVLGRELAETLIQSTSRQG
jgi:hypothetical protein